MTDVERAADVESGGRQVGGGRQLLLLPICPTERQFSLAPRGHFVRIGGGVGVVVDVHDDIIVGVVVDVHDGSISLGVLFIEFVDSVVKNTLDFVEPRGSGVSVVHVGDTTIKSCVEKRGA